MPVERQLLAPCGLYCGACGIQIAHRDRDRKLKARLATVYGCSPADIACEGCKSQLRFKFCDVCPIRDCTRGKGIEGCHECDEFPCEVIEEFPFESARTVMKRAIPRWREAGTEQWVAEEEARYTCPACGARLFRGLTHCRRCGAEVAPD